MRVAFAFALVAGSALGCGGSSPAAPRAASSLEARPEAHPDVSPEPVAPSPPTTEATSAPLPAPAGSVAGPSAAPGALVPYPPEPPVNLTAEQIEIVVRAHALDARRGCWDRVSSPTSSADETVTLTIDRVGVVRNAEATGNDYAMGHCVAGAMRAWTFPAARGPSTVRIPFHFVRETRVPSTATVPFDRGAVAEALGKIDPRGCERAGGPRGSGHVLIVFLPDGSVGTAWVDQPPFAGTESGACVAGRFRATRVPPFAGDSVTVGKSFVLE